MGMRKPNKGKISPHFYRSRDTAHVQPPNWRDPLVYSQNADIIYVYDNTLMSKTTKPINIKI